MRQRRMYSFRPDVSDLSIVSVCEQVKFGEKIASTNGAVI